jgi:UDP-3-O-[3-hydroxymyristoyl] glucosamine N-acyltransferase
MSQIDHDLVRKATGLDLDGEQYGGLGLAKSNHAKSLLTFLADSKYAEDVNSNPNIGAVLVKKNDAAALAGNVKKIIVEDPLWVFFSIVDYLGRNKYWPKSEIHPSARIHPASFISPAGVKIGSGTIVDANVTIEPGVRIGENSRIRPGAVLGVDGYEHKKTTKGILSVAHDGELVIGDRCEVGSNTFVAKGFSYRTSIIGDDSKLDTLIHYAHGVQCGKRCLIVSNAMIGGNVTMGNDVWVGPSASIANRLTIGDGAFITMGSVVTRDVLAGEKVTGNFAIPHATFLKNLKLSLQ